MADEGAALLRRIDRLEARFDIGELATAYAIACDEHDMDRLIGLFTEAAQFDSPSGIMRAEGRDAIRAMFVRMFRIRGPAFHWTHDRSVAFDEADADRATGTVLSHAETSPDGKTSLAAMRYDDTYRRVGGCWLFERRKINFLYYVPAGEYADVFATAARVRSAGRRLDADFPETLPSWRNFAKEHGG
jgi:ketosteroid isomerase-like protein